jgi:DNA-binding transcriptional MerR regulator
VDRRGRWTIDALGAEVAAALAIDYAGPANGQVRAVPDPRTIRYYATLGLIDPPAEMRGRTALYGLRHLRQLVAIKRLQAEGLSLAQIQERLAGAPDGTLVAISKLAGPSPTSAPVSPPQAGRRAAAFWRETPTAPSAAAEAEGAVEPERPEAIEADSRALNTVSGAADVVGVGLHPEVVLLIPSRRIEEEDREAIQNAAASLLEVLRERGLIGPRSSGERGSS